MEVYYLHREEEKAFLMEHVGLSISVGKYLENSILIKIHFNENLTLLYKVNVSFMF